MDRTEYEATAEAQAFDAMRKRKEQLWSEYLIVRETARMQLILAHGVHPVYDDFTDFLYDYHPDFSWNADASKAEMMLLLGSKVLVDLAEKIKLARGFDFVTEWKEALEFDPDNC